MFSFSPTFCLFFFDDPSPSTKPSEGLFSPEVDVGTEPAPSVEEARVGNGAKAGISEERRVGGVEGVETGAAVATVVKETALDLTWVRFPRFFFGCPMRTGVELGEGAVLGGRLSGERVGKGGGEGQFS